MASLRHRRGMAESEQDDDDDVHDDGSRTAPDDTTDTATEEEEEEEEEDRRLHLGLDSMTAKGIQHLCSELLEIKKASEQDFRANVYVSYLSFIRMFQEAGDLGKDVHRLKLQAMAHNRLIQRLRSDCLYSSSSILLAGSAGSSKEEEAGISMDDDGGRDDDELELDVLLSEHRMEQALELLERQGQALRSSADEAALSARKARVADRLASVAGDPRTPRPELLRALSGLCKLGHVERANHLLFASYRTSVVRGVEELRAESSSQAAAHHQSSSNYIRDLARMVFSSIVHASRSFVSLHGHPSPYTPQLLRWAREEMEDFGAAFSEYVRSMPRQAGQSLALALEAAECAVSYSPLLRRLGIASEQDVAGLMAPCIREVLAMYGRHLKEVVRLLVDSDSWELGRFRFRHADEHYCLLTTSGRKFVTLVQEVVDDVACPLQNLGMDDGAADDSAAAQLVAELFREYMDCIVQQLIPGKEDGDDEHQYMRQLSVLISCGTLVSLLPTMAHGAWSAPAQREMGGLVREAAGQVWSCFCQQFIRDTMALSASAAAAQQGGTPAQGQGAAGTTTTMMPSLAFQVVFLRVRQLRDAYGGILSGEDGTMRKLLRELMEAIVSWLSTNLPESWVVVHGAAQAQLDVHFLMEIARLGGFDVTASALDLLREARAKVGDDDGEEDRGWAADAAKHAVQVLLLQSTPIGSAAAAPPREEEEEDNGDVPAAVDAAEEFESDDMDELRGQDDMAEVEEAPPEDAKSSDEFISMEDDDEEKLTLKLTGGDQQAAPPPPQSDDDGSSRGQGDDDGSRRRRRLEQATPLAAAAAAKGNGDNAPGRSRKQQGGGEQKQQAQMAVTKNRTRMPPSPIHLAN